MCLPAIRQRLVCLPEAGPDRAQHCKTRPSLEDKDLDRPQGKECEPEKGKKEIEKTAEKKTGA